MKSPKFSSSGFYIILTVLVLTIALVFAGQENPEQITPEEFQHWEVIKVVPGQSGLYWLFFRNPDYFSNLKIIAGLVNVEFVLLGYRYFRGVNVYEFKLEPETGKYIGGLLTGEKRRLCIKCHKKLGREAS